MQALGATEAQFGDVETDVEDPFAYLPGDTQSAKRAIAEAAQAHSEHWPLS